jgi:hypothetical protein
MRPTIENVCEWIAAGPYRISTAMALGGLAVEGGGALLESIDRPSVASVALMSAGLGMAATGVVTAPFNRHKYRKHVDSTGNRTLRELSDIPPLDDSY